MRVLFVHNAYQQRGGEDSGVDDEIRLMRDHGHEVELYRRDNHDIESMAKLAVAGIRCGLLKRSGKSMRCFTAFVLTWFTRTTRFPWFRHPCI